MATPAMAQGTVPMERGAHEYQACFQLVERAPQQALEAALNWERIGGGDAARHCRAVAMIRTGQVEDGAMELERLAQLLPSEKAALASSLFGQAAQAWLLADEPQRALMNVGLGLKVDAGNIDLLVQRAEIYASGGLYADALTDLDKAVTLAPGDAIIHAFRAAARRHLGQIAPAEADIATALRLDPRQPQALLERGYLHQQAGRREAARADWLMVLQVAPNTPAAEAARRGIEQIDLQ